MGKLFRDKNDVLINTKFGNIPFKGKNFNIEDLKESFNQSLTRISRESINILFLHNPRDEVEDLKPFLDLMEDLKRKGKIKYKGISLAKGYDYSRKIDLNEFDVIQDDCSLLSMNFLNMNLLKSTLFMARSPLASGILSDRLTENTSFPKDDHRSVWLKEERLASIMKRVNTIKKISNIELSSLARRFLLKNSKINKIIFGVKKKSHVDNIIVDLNKPPLDSIIEKKLIELYRNDYGLNNERHLGW